MRAAALVTPLLCLALAACGGGGGGNGAGLAGTTPAPPAPPPPPPPSSDYTPIAAAKPTTGTALQLGKCVNMGDQLEAPNEGDWGRGIEDSDFTTIYDAGFRAVRIPVRFSGHALTAAPYTIDATFMARVRHVVDTAVAAKLHVIIDLHNYDELMADPAGQTERFAQLWRQVAEAFKDEPTGVYFELINEPNTNLTNATLPAVIAPALAQIRMTNPTRPVVIDGEMYAAIASLATLQMPDDPYVVPTIHDYDPFEFTHQGATFLDNPPPVGRVFGGQADIDQANANIKTVRDYITRTGRVPFVGEYGAIDDTGISDTQRNLYYHTVSASFASIGVQSCAWSFTNTFVLYTDAGGWKPGILDAIETTTDEGG